MVTVTFMVQHTTTLAYLSHHNRRLHAEQRPASDGGCGNPAGMEINVAKFPWRWEIVRGFPAGM